MKRYRFNELPGRRRSFEPAEASAFPAASLLERNGLVRLCRVVEIPFTGLGVSERI